MAATLPDSGRQLKHVQVREYVRSLIDKAEPGSLAPSERELVEHFGVARMTVRQALDALVSEGLLERVPGRGTFVARARRSVTTGGRMLGFSEEISRRGMTPGQRTIVGRIEPAGAGVSRALAIPLETPVLRWQRVRYADDTAIAVQDAWMLSERVPGMLYEFDDGRGLMELLRRRGIVPQVADDVVEASLAVPEEAILLDISEGAAVLRVSRVIQGDQGPLVAVRTCYRADRFALRMRVTRGGFPEPRRP